MSTESISWVKTPSDRVPYKLETRGLVRLGDILDALSSSSNYSHQELLKAQESLDNAWEEIYDFMNQGGIALTNGTTFRLPLERLQLPTRVEQIINDTGIVEMWSESFREEAQLKYNDMVNFGVLGPSWLVFFGQKSNSRLYIGERIWGGTRPHIEKKLGIQDLFGKGGSFPYHATQAIQGIVRAQYIKNNSLPLVGLKSAERGILVDLALEYGLGMRPDITE